MRVETIKRQTMAAYGWLVVGQSVGPLSRLYTRSVCDMYSAAAGVVCGLWRYTGVICVWLERYRCAAGIVVWRRFDCGRKTRSTVRTRNARWPSSTTRNEQNARTRFSRSSDSWSRRRQRSRTDGPTTSLTIATVHHSLLVYTAGFWGRETFFNRGVEVKNPVLSCNMISRFSPHPLLKSCWLLMHFIAITLTPDRHKRHMQFLTSAPNFRGEGPLTPMTRLSRAPGPAPLVLQHAPSGC